MRAIVKGAEPRSLLHHRMQVHSNYDNYLQKDELRAALVSEQRGLCCYCMGRIRADIDSMKVEHWQCQATYPEQQLTYTNLLGACRGGEKNAPHEQHCDTRKANLDLKWNPATHDHMIEVRVRYLSDGRVDSCDAEFDDQLNSVLNLNLPFLKNNRKVVVDTVLRWWRSTPPARRNLQAQINKRIGKLEELEPFSPVAVWLLRRKMVGLPT